MLLSELGGKEIVNLNDGGRLGMIADSDVIIDENTGKIISLLLPDKRVQFKLFGEKEEIEIPWDSIKKVGDDMIIVEIEDY
ncbi:YlmC/YmxH family sporulation protein [Anaerosalibacter bizertensis]|uniref:YlmC/YmxH family sporulation protein n=1 Tax=Anaerosalibacter bizertensis TaxID=932217 RepID=A0A844FG70_9FIRM|nr:YlmC/YmxH family sporulation protein [Anaerosalibacter bizertensis]MBV1818575.1 YlmC/YmxH family sporulation protein [Bacteroidales bacterium MSK.15.36]HHV27285.1 YlmC/YmxH family sporulation protein [Tissierellia bacterium]MBU5293245.1 YlmC/YmxH family sporulation protein [Anaerosalibacter bizertensis]MCB5558769.1 YlmC/YmxH family sporulation protein [Anaerosalibacter bizertensis]MCG4564601.1 YlmC/YmxH family sporulation protein [Anaerosalibacter bizertensis]